MAEKIEGQDLVAIGERLRAARRKARLSQVELARRLHCDSTYICAVEHGKRTLRIDRFLRWVEELRVSADYILRGETTKYRGYLYTSVLQRLAPLKMGDQAKILHLFDSCIRELYK